MRNDDDDDVLNDYDDDFINDDWQGCESSTSALLKKAHEQAAELSQLSLRRLAHRPGALPSCPLP